MSLSFLDSKLDFTEIWYPQLLKGSELKGHKRGFLQ